MTSVAFNFIDFIDWLNSKVIHYCIPWGYEKLPNEVSGGDVDIFVHPSHYCTVAQELIRSGYSEARCPADSSEHLHAQFGRVDCYTIHLFSSFCFRLGGKTVLLKIDPELLLRGKTRYKKMYIADPVVELLLTTLRIVAGRKDCFERLKKHLEVIK